MKNKTAYLYLICFGLLLNSSTSIAQTVNEIKFKLLGKSSNADSDLVTVSAFINTKQPLSGNGIHFTLVVKNNSGNIISAKNIANQLSLTLYDERGFDVSIYNEGLNDAKINRRFEDRAWKFRSKSIVPDKVFVNGKEDKKDIKMQEYIEIPAGGEWKINLILRDVKQVETPQDEQNKFLKPIIKIAPGKYRLRVFLLINPKIISYEQNRPVEYSGVYYSPMIDIDYSK